MKTLFHSVVNNLPFVRRVVSQPDERPEEITCLHGRITPPEATQSIALMDQLPVAREKNRELEDLVAELRKQVSALAANATIQAAVAPARFMDVPSEWLTLADGSGYFVGVSFAGTTTRDGVLVVFTCEGRHVLTQRFGPASWIQLVPGSPAQGPAPSYVRVLETSVDLGRPRSAQAYYRFRRGRLVPLGRLAIKQVVRQDSTNATEEWATVSWKETEPYVIQRCGESRPLRLDLTTGAWTPDSSTRRYFAEVYRLDGDDLRLETRADHCLGTF